MDEDGSQLGIRPTSEAVQMAQAKGKDLVEIAPQAAPPVCKIIDYSKYLYEQDKKNKEAKKKNKGGHLKEVRLSPRIGEHDLEIKLNHARDFLSEQNKVQITVVFRGRENQHRDLGYALIQKIGSYLAGFGEIEGRPAQMGNRLIVMVVPVKK